MYITTDHRGFLWEKRHYKISASYSLCDCNKREEQSLIEDEDWSERTESELHLWPSSLCSISTRILIKTHSHYRIDSNQTTPTPWYTLEPPITDFPKVCTQYQNHYLPLNHWRREDNLSIMDKWLVCPTVSLFRSWAHYRISTSGSTDLLQVAWRQLSGIHSSSLLLPVRMASPQGIWHTALLPTPHKEELRLPYKALILPQTMCISLLSRKTGLSSWANVKKME